MIFVDCKDTENENPNQFSTGFENKTKSSDQWQSEYNDLNKHRNQLQNLTNDNQKTMKDSEKLRQDVSMLNTRIEAMNKEHRNAKNQWSRDKADLEGRIYQLNALNTQLQGTMKKKEKNAEKIQAQLSKLVKDSNKGNKSSIYISAPIKSNMSQNSQNSKAAELLLRDSEVIANKQTIAQLNSENKTLRGALQEMENHMNTMNDQFQEAIDHEKLKTKTKIEAMTVEHVKVIAQQQKKIATLQKHWKAKEQADLGHKNLSKFYLEGSPNAHSTEYLVNKLNTEVKHLNIRAQQLSSEQQNTNNALARKKQPLTEGITVYLEFIKHHPQYGNIKRRLLEAVAVIEEQDQIIHEALLCNGKSSHIDQQMQKEKVGIEAKGRATQNDINSDIKEENDIKEVEEEMSLHPSLPGMTAYTMTDVGKTTTTSSPSYADTDSEFELPPASPATIEVLEKMGWSPSLLEKLRQKVSVTTKTVSYITESQIDGEQLDFA